MRMINMAQDDFLEDIESLELEDSEED